MRIPVVLALATLPLTPLSAQQAKPTPEPPKPKVVATPTPKPKGVLGRIFGPKATPTPAPVATPTPKPKPKPRPKPKAQEEATEPAEPATEKPPVNGETPKPTEPAEPKPETKPEPKPAVATPAPKPPKGGKKPAVEKPEKPDFSGLDDAAKFKIVKAKALEDEKVKELKAKADSALTDEEAQRANQAFNNALFRKVREIEPSLDGYVDRIEQALKKRVSAEKKD